MSMMPPAAKAPSSRMTAREEWTIHVRRAAKRIAMMGSLCNGPIMRGRVSDVLSGSVASRTSESDRSIRPIPMKMEKICFLRPPWSFFM